MQSIFRTYYTAKTSIESTITFKLLKARNMPLIASFLYKEFKGVEQSTIPYSLLRDKLADYLEKINYAENDDEINNTGKLILHYEDKAKLYLENWIEAYYLLGVVDDSTKELNVMLSKHTQKLFQIFELLKEKEYVNTESKFQDIFNKLRDIIEHANPDKQTRLQELEKRKQAIENEIRRIKIDDEVPVYESYQIKSRFDDVNRLSNELISDFREVEENFGAITRRIYEKQQNSDFTKGQLINETFDALYELRNTDQGKSFYAFWQFMIDDTRQEELQQLTTDIYRILDDREIVYPAKSLRKLKILLHSAGRKVLDKNYLLSDKLSREVVAKEQAENRRAKELMANIRKLAFQLVGQPLSRTDFMMIDGVPEISMPMERKLSEKRTEQEFIARPKIAVNDIGNLEALAIMYNNELVSKQTLLDNIYTLLEEQEQVTLQEVTNTYPISMGLAELLTYITLVNHSSKFFINAEKEDIILFDTTNQKYLKTPQIIFSK